MSQRAWFDAMFPVTMLHELPEWAFPRWADQVSRLSSHLQDKLLEEALRREFWLSVFASLDAPQMRLYSDKRLPLLTGDKQPSTTLELALIVYRTQYPTMSTAAWKILTDGVTTTSELQVLASELAASVSDVGAWKNIPRLMSYMTGAAHAVAAFAPANTPLPELLKDQLRETVGKIRNARLPWVSSPKYSSSALEGDLNAELYQSSVDKALVLGLSAQQKLVVFNSLPALVQTPRSKSSSAINEALRNAIALAAAT